MKTIYIFVKEPIEQKIVKIDVCDDYLFELDKLNQSLLNVGDSTNKFSAFAIFDLAEDDISSSKLRTVLESIIFSRKYKGLSETYYHMNPEEAFNILSALLVFSNFKYQTSLSREFSSTPKPTKWKRSQNKTKSSHVKTKSAKQKVDTIDKESALILLQNNGIKFLNENINFGSYNSVDPYFWVNPNVTCLDKDWYLILNDISRRLLILFFIPFGSFSVNDFKVRLHGNHYALQLTISNDDKFKDLTQGKEFYKYLICKYSYSDSDYKHKSKSVTNPNTLPVNTVDHGHKHVSLDKIDKPMNYKLLDFYYLDKKYDVKNWRQMLDSIFKIVYAAKSSLLIDLANKNSSPFGGEKVYVTSNPYVKNTFIDAHELFDTGIFYEMNLSQDGLCKFIKWLLVQCEYSLSDFTVDYYVTK